MKTFRNILQKVKQTYIIYTSVLPVVPNQERIRASTSSSSLLYQEK